MSTNKTKPMDLNYMLFFIYLTYCWCDSRFGRVAEGFQISNTDVGFLSLGMADVEYKNVL